MLSYVIMAELYYIRTRSVNEYNWTYNVCVATHFIVAHYQCELNYICLENEAILNVLMDFLRWIRLWHRSEFAIFSNSVLRNRKNLTKIFSFYIWYMWAVLSPIYFQKHTIYFNIIHVTVGSSFQEEYTWLFVPSDSLAKVVGNTESIYLPYCDQQLLTIDSKGDAFVMRTYLITALLSDLERD